MSDYMYLLDSHLSREQNRLLLAIQNAGIDAGVAIYLTGGAMRDMLGGFPIRDLDFTYEGAASPKLLSLVREAVPGVTIEEDNLRKCAELTLEGVTASVRTARTQRVNKPGGVPKISLAHLLDDLAQRDFTINAIALSLAKASRGLIRDPMNGISDLQNREIRVCYANAFFEEPVRLLRAVRLRHRMGFQIEERTARLFATAVEEGWIKNVTVREWRDELERIAEEHQAAEILGELETAGLLPVAAGQLNLEGVAKFARVRRSIPGRATHWGLFVNALFENSKPKERTAALEAFGLESNVLDFGKKAKARAGKLALEIKGPGFRKPSQVYHGLVTVDPSDLLQVLYASEFPVVQERVSAFLDKYLPEASEVTDAQVEATGVKLGSPAFAKAKAAMITARLNAPPAPDPPTVPPGAPNSPTISPSARAIR